MALTLCSVQNRTASASNNLWLGSDTSARVFRSTYMDANSISIARVMYVASEYTASKGRVFYRSLVGMARRISRFVSTLCHSVRPVASQSGCTKIAFLLTFSGKNWSFLLGPLVLLRVNMVCNPREHIRNL